VHVYATSRDYEADCGEGRAFGTESGEEMPSGEAG
jgi:hypothetical protein